MSLRRRPHQRHHLSRRTGSLLRPSDWRFSRTMLAERTGLPSKTVGSDMWRQTKNLTTTATKRQVYIDRGKCILITLKWFNSDKKESVHHQSRLWGLHIQPNDYAWCMCGSTLYSTDNWQQHIKKGYCQRIQLQKQQRQDTVKEIEVSLCLIILEYINSYVFQLASAIEPIDTLSTW